MVCSRSKFMMKGVVEVSMEIFGKYLFGKNNLRNGVTVIQVFGQRSVKRILLNQTTFSPASFSSNDM